MKHPWKRLWSQLPLSNADKVHPEKEMVVINSNRNFIPNTMYSTTNIPVNPSQNQKKNKGKTFIMYVIEIITKTLALGGSCPECGIPT